MEENIKYLCKCGSRFDKPGVRKEKNQSYYICPVCKIMTGLPDGIEEK